MLDQRVVSVLRCAFIVSIWLAARSLKTRRVKGSSEVIIKKVFGCIMSPRYRKGTRNTTQNSASVLSTIVCQKCGSFSPTPTPRSDISPGSLRLLRLQSLTAEIQGPVDSGGPPYHSSGPPLTFVDQHSSPIDRGHSAGLVLGSPK